MITIREIAALAGVSRGTVDRVINKRGSVSPFVEARVAGIIKQFDYKPNKAARALVKSKKSYTIGVISATVGNVFFKDVVQGIRRAAAEVRTLGVSIRYREVARFSVAEQLACLREMMAEGIDALAINPINDPAIREKLTEAAEDGVPLVTFNSDIEGVDRMTYIGCDYRNTGRIAAGLLALAAGEKAEVAVVTGSTKSLGHCLRVEGFREELRRYPAMRIAKVVEMFDDEAISRARVSELLRGNEGIDAFFFCAAGKEGGIEAILEARPERRPVIVTVDIDAFTRERLLDETVVATVCQEPHIQGYEPVRQLADFLVFGEKPMRRFQYTRSEIVIRQNAASARQDAEESVLRHNRG